MPERLAYSPAEFAALFGREQTWAYRKIYAGQIKVISSLGNRLIPASEAERILASADYEGLPVVEVDEPGENRAS